MSWPNDGHRVDLPPAASSEHDFASALPGRLRGHVSTLGAVECVCQDRGAMEAARTVLVLSDDLLEIAAELEMRGAPRPAPARTPATDLDYEAAQLRLKAARLDEEAAKVRYLAALDEAEYQKLRLRSLDAPSNPSPVSSFYQSYRPAPKEQP